MALQRRVFLVGHEIYDRREVSAFLVRLGQESKEWKEETARRLDEMGTGNKFSLSELKGQINRA
ncbi:MAG: hypothetical protein JJT96_02605 [Opitutales bacterium]|nr:hypothetical protein [Opitutales bacterium]